MGTGIGSSLDRGIGMGTVRVILVGIGTIIGLGMERHPCRNKYRYTYKYRVQV